MSRGHIVKLPIFYKIESNFESKINSLNFFDIHKCKKIVKCQNIRHFIHLRPILEKACPGDISQILGGLSNNFQINWELAN